MPFSMKEGTPEFCREKAAIHPWSEAGEQAASPDTLQEISDLTVEDRRNKLSVMSITVDQGS
jgi:hypothetical protein